MMGDLRTFFRGYSRLPGGFVVRTRTETVCKYAPMSRSNGAAYGTASVINTTNYKPCWIHPTCTVPKIKNWSLRTSVHIRHKSTESTYQRASNSQQAAPIYISQNSMPDLSWISFTQRKCLGYTCFKWGPFRVDFAWIVSFGSRQHLAFENTST